MPVSGSRRLMSIRTSAEFDADAMSATTAVAQQAAAISSVRSWMSARHRPGRSQIHSRSPAGVGRAARISGRLPVRLVMMNWLKQVRMRCRVTRHQATALMLRRTGPIAAGTPTIAAVMRSGGRVWCARPVPPSR